MVARDGRRRRAAPMRDERTCEMTAIEIKGTKILHQYIYAA